MKLDRIIAVSNKKTVYRDGDRCLKVFNEGYCKADIFNEALNHTRVEQTDLHIPRILEVSEVDGKWTIISDFIKGKTLEQIMQENPNKKEEYLEQFVDIQLNMHSQTCAGLNLLKDKMNRKISETDLSATARYDLHTRLDAMPKHNKLCHGDFNPSNIIITDDGTPYIIDWSHATQGNASADAARTYLLFWLKGDIAGAGRYLELFCEKADIAKQYVQSWMPIVAASQSVKGNEAEREFLNSWINVVDYE